MAEGKSERKLLSDAFFVAAASAFSYAVAYAYRAGFASYFDLPPLLLTPTLGAMLHAAAAIGAVLAMFAMIVNNVWLFLPKTMTAVTRRIYLLVFMTVLFALVFYRLFTYKWGWLILVGISCFFGFFEFIFPLITRRNVAGYENKLIAQDKFDDSQLTLLDQIGNRFGYKGMGLVFLVVVLLLFAHSVGYANAKEQEDFFVLADAPDYVVAAIDDDMAILVAYDVTTMTLKRTFIVRRLASEHIWSLEKKHIGKLVQPAPLKASPERATQPTATPSESPAQSQDQ